MITKVYNQFVTDLKATGLSESYAIEIGQLMSKSLYNSDEVNNPAYYDEIMEARLMKVKKAIQSTLINTKHKTVQP